MAAYNMQLLRLLLSPTGSMISMRLLTLLLLRRTDTFAVAQQLGVGAILQTSPSLSPARIAEELVKLLPPYGPDVVIDCAGFDSTLQVSCVAAWLHNADRNS